MVKNRTAEATSEALLKRRSVRAPPIDVAALAVAQGARIKRELLDSNVSGLMVRRPDGRVVIGVNRMHHTNRQRFTIAHEIGHMVLHGSQPSVFVDDVMVHFRADAGTRLPDPREIEANAFAAALLMPAAMLERDVHGRVIDVSEEKEIRRLARRYAVSQQALTIRLLSLGLLAGLPDRDRDPEPRGT
jgi:Zn-dependent peptidase ImmA (M78 family)